MRNREFIRKRARPRLNIGFDIDGVVCDLNSEFTRRVREAFQVQVPDEPDEYNYVYYDHQDLNNKVNLFEFMDGEFKKGMLADCDPYPESLIFITNLLNENFHNIYFITARGTSDGWCKNINTTNVVRDNTFTWIKKYFPTFKIENLIFNSDKTETVQEYDIDIMIEDKHSMAEKLADYCKSLLITRGWNKNNADIKCTRVNSIVEIVFFL